MKSFKKTEKVKIYVFIILFLYPLIAHSNNNWVKVATAENGHIFYINKEQIEEDNNFIYFWKLINYQKPDEYGDLSAKIYIKVLCEKLQFQWLYISYHKKQMGQDNTPVKKASEVVSAWQEPSANSTSKKVIEYVCNYVGLKL